MGATHEEEMEKCGLGLLGDISLRNLPWSGCHELGFRQPRSPWGNTVKDVGLCSFLFGGLVFA